MKIKRIFQLGSATLVSLSSLLAISMPLAHAAGTHTWTGTDCVSPTPDCTWSDVNNWQEGTAPSGGDDLIFDNAVLEGQADSPTNDIPSLNVDTITFINNNSGSATSESILTGDLTVNSAITQDSSASVTADTIFSGLSGGIVTLGGDVTVTSFSGLNFGSGASGEEIDLNGNTLTFLSGAGAPSNIVAIDEPIVGNGTVTYNSSVTNYQLWQGNTYSGTTNVIASNLPVGNVTANTNGFGTSAINVGTAGSIEFGYNAPGTISNAITIAGTTNISQITSLNFNCDTGCGSAITLAVPNITLNGNTRFAAATEQTINLAGIVTNGHCVEYIVNSGNDASHFPGGPAACIVSGGTAPAAPKTGFASLIHNPIAALATSMAAAASILLISRRLQPAKR